MLPARCPTNQALKELCTGVFVHRSADVDSRIREAAVRLFTELVRACLVD
jgi:hypothetical protein